MSNKPTRALALIPNLRRAIGIEPELALSISLASGLGATQWRIRCVFDIRFPRSGGASKVGDSHGMLLQHEDHITGKLSFKPEEEIGGASRADAAEVIVAAFRQKTLLRLDGGLG